MKRSITIADTHYTSKYLDMLYGFISDFKPDYFNILGDFFDFTQISKYEAHKRNSKGIMQVINECEAELKWGNDVLDKLDGHLKNCTKTFTIGNHDKRHDEFFLYEYPQKNHESLVKEINLVERKWNVVGFGGFHRIGKLYYQHGDGYNGDFFTKTSCVKVRRNLRSAHHHTNQTYTMPAPLNSTRVTEVKSFGCLCEKDPDYLKGTTNRWVNSFIVGYHMDNGNFQDFVVNIINGKFVAPNGKIYG